MSSVAIGFCFPKLHSVTKNPFLSLACLSVRLKFESQELRKELKCNTHYAESVTSVIFQQSPGRGEFLVLSLSTSIWFIINMFN
jgi:hypothetical protein